MQSYTPLVPITGINEEFCFCFLLVAGLILHFNGSCWEIMRAAADGAGVLLQRAMATQPGPALRGGKPHAMRPAFGEGGKEEKWFVLPTAELSWLRPWGWNWGQEPSGAVGPAELWDQQHRAPLCCAGTRAGAGLGGCRAPSTLCQQSKRRSALQLLLPPAPPEKNG